jgi:uncharacterized protein (DUF1810 family)
MTDADLIRFVNAQTEVYSQVIEELADGSKRTHWMRFIFPQLTGDPRAQGPRAFSAGISNGCGCRRRRLDHRAQ